MAGILGRKIGMTNIFDAEGNFIPITVMEAGPCPVLETKTKERSGYDAVLLGFGEKKAKNTSKPEKAWYEKLKISPRKFIKEIRTAEPLTCKAGDEIRVNVFKKGDFVDVTGLTIGKGFQGGMKRWHWGGGEAGHGSMFHRAPGSIGASSFPSRVHKGKTLPGHMGSVTRTVQNLEIVDVDESDNTLAVRGSIPGHRGTFIAVRHAKKRPPKAESGKKPEAEKPGEKKK